MKRTAVLLTIVAVAFALIYAFFAVKSQRENVVVEEEKNVRVLSVEIITESLRCEKETLDAFFKLNGAGKLPPGGGDDYQSFLSAYDDCSNTLDSLEKRLDELKPTIPSFVKLKATSGELISLQRAMVGAKKFCADWMALSNGTPEEIVCTGQGSDAIAAEYHDALKMSRGLDRLIAKSGGAWQSSMDLFYAEQIKSGGETTEKPNVLFILVDALRGDEIFREDENNQPVMPFLSKLASEGVVYDKAFAPAATTLTVIPSIFTGLNPVDAGSVSASESWNFKKSLIPEFEKMGYFTAALSANSLISPEYNFAAGFSRFKARNWFPAGIVLPEAYSQLKYRLVDSPFLLYVHLIDPHDPYFPPSDDAARNIVPADDSMVADPNILRNKYIREGIDPRGRIAPENINYLRKLYDAESTYVDGEIKKFIDNLSASGFLDNTLVIITADHGEAFLEHGDVKHSLQFYDEYLSVPLILWGKLPDGLKPNSRVVELHSTTEIFPSILKWIKGETPADVAKSAELFSTDGGNRRVFAAGGGLALDRSELGHRLYAVRDEKYKLIYDVKAERFALFNLVEDPGETTDLSASKTEALSDMKAALFKEFHLDSTSEKPAEKEPSKKLQKEMKDLGYIR